MGLGEQNAQSQSINLFPPLGAFLDDMTVIRAKHKAEETQYSKDAFGISIAAVHSRKTRRPSQPSVEYAPNC